MPVINLQSMLVSCQDCPSDTRFTATTTPLAKPNQSSLTSAYVSKLASPQKLHISCATLVGFWLSKQIGALGVEEQDPAGKEMN